MVISESDSATMAWRRSLLHRQIEGNAEGIHVEPVLSHCRITLHVFKGDIEIGIEFLLRQLMPRLPFFDEGLVGS